MADRVKVMMSSYNGARYIKEQIDSIIAQENVLVDLFIRDDGSVDGTIDILREIEAQHKNVNVCFANNVGPCRSFLELLFSDDSIEFDYYAFSDQDDIWMPDKLKRAIECIEDETKPALYYSALLTFQEATGKKQVVSNEREYSFAESFFQSHYPGCTMVWNRAGMKLIQGISKPNTAIMHDLFLVQVFMGTDNKIIYDKESKIKYRIHGDNLSVKKDNLAGEILRYRKILKNQKNLRYRSAKAYREVMGNRLAGDKLKIINTIVEYNKTFASRCMLAKMISHTKFTAKTKVVFILAVLAGFY